jgi:hypothetical protein
MPVAVATEWDKAKDAMGIGVFLARMFFLFGLVALPRAVHANIVGVNPGLPRESTSSEKARMLDVDPASRLGQGERRPGRQGHHVERCKRVMAYHYLLHQKKR